MAYASENSHEEAKVATLVFMDLETTGLPHNVGTKNVHITEIALVAVSREEFIGSKDNFRVINKLNLCVRPRAAISLGAMNVTGLDNVCLESQAPFDVSIALVLHEFILRLQQPVCLLAHNGNRYDFPILQAELLRIGRSLPYQLLCADTLQAFRSFGPDKLKSQCNNVDSENDKLMTNSHYLTEETINQMLSNEIEVFANIPQNSNEGQSKAIHMQPCTELPPVAKVLEQGWMTARHQEMTPVKKNNSLQILPNNKQNYFPNDNRMTSGHYNQNSEPVAKRKLLLEGISVKQNGAKAPPSQLPPTGKLPKVQYSLEKLYIRFFGKSPNESHHAENDCIALMKVCHQIKETFLEWLDKNSKLFTDTVPMWKAP